MILYIDQPPNTHWPVLIDHSETVQQLDSIGKEQIEATDQEDGWYNEQEF